MAVGDVRAAFRLAWRKYVTDGVPASGDHNPVKDEIFVAGDAVESRLVSLAADISAVAGAGGVGVSVIYALRSELFADLAHVAGTLGAVYADPTVAFNGIYIKVGGSGSGSWSLTDLLLPASVTDELAALDAAIAQEIDDRTTADLLKAPLASPTLTGVPVAPTAAPGANNTQIATTAYANAAVGVEEAARIAADALKANIASPTFTGQPLAPTAAPGTNSTQIATTDFVAALGALKAPLASPTFTGTPAAPTPTQGDNDTSIATTAFVTTAVAAEATIRDDADIALQAELDATAALIEPSAAAGYAWVIAGPAGEFPVGLTDAGILEVAYSEPRVFAGASGRLARELLIPRPTLPAELLLVVSYGQSLSLGHGTGAPISTSAEQYGALRFTAGPRAYAGAGSDDADHATLIPYIEVQETTFGESPLYGCLETIGDRLKYESGGSPIDFGLVMIGEALGENSQAINALKVGTYFDRIGVATTYGRTRAREVNKSFQLGGMIFTEGEADDLAGTSSANYITRFGELRTNLLAAITPITGQAEVPIIMNQVASHQQSGLTAPLTALAQLTLGRTLAASKVYLACPSYMFDFVDGYHLEPESSHMLGCYYGLALKRVLIDDVDWPFLDIASHQRVIGSGGVENVVIVRFTVPHPPLQFSTALVSQIANEGFTMVAAASEAATTISSVGLFGANAIKIVCSAVIPANARLRYAWIGTSGSGRQTGPRGNVCDSQGDIIKVASAHGARRLDNYLPMLEYVIS